MLCCHVRLHTFPTRSTLAIQSLCVAVLHVQARRPVAGTPRRPRVSPSLPFFSPFFLPRLFFLRPFASLFHASSVVPTRLAWFRSCRPSCGSPRSSCGSPSFEGETGKDPIGVLLEPSAGFSWRCFPRCFPCFPAVRGTGTKMGGTEGARDRGYGRTGFPGLPFRNVSVVGASVSSLGPSTFGGSPVDALTLGLG